MAKLTMCRVLVGFQLDGIDYSANQFLQLPSDRIKALEGFVDSSKGAVAYCKEQGFTLLVHADGSDSSVPDLDTVPYAQDVLGLMGAGEPGDTLTVTWTDGQTLDVQVAADGKWQAAYPASIDPTSPVTVKVKESA